jgi:arsenate reductase (thioredoxin)
MLKVIFLCTANSCRSQMAEGFAWELGRGIIEPHSAGIMAAGVHPRAAAVMKEIGISIYDQESKEIDPDLLLTMDVIITLCGHAERTCPQTPPDIKRLHWPIEDPVGTFGTEAFVMKDFRRARDEIRDRIVAFIQEISRTEGR